MRKKRLRNIIEFLLHISTHLAANLISEEKFLTQEQILCSFGRSNVTEICTKNVCTKKSTYQKSYKTIKREQNLTIQLQSFRPSELNFML